MIGDYQIVRITSTGYADADLAKLSAAVQRLCGEGWAPTGGPFYVAGNNSWAQAMTRGAQNGSAKGDIKLKEGRR